MRTTLTIDDDVLKAAQSLARARSVTVGAVLSELARAGLRAGRAVAAGDSIPRFTVSESASAFGVEQVRAIDDEGT